MDAVLGEEEVLVHASEPASSEDLEFDEVINALQDALMDDKFSAAQGRFLDQYCGEFEDTEENKLVYTQIFIDYVAYMERCIDDMLRERIPNFSAEAFAKVALSRPREELEGDAIDLLLSLQDFSEFKALMLSHKMGSMIDLTSMLVITSQAPSNEPMSTN